MNPAIIAALASKSTDVEAIVAIVGWANLFKIIPHALAIGEAIQKAKLHFTYPKDGCSVAAPEGIAALAAGLFWPSDAKVLVMWGYYDESGEYDAKGKPLNMTIGGCFSSLERWQALDVGWQKALSAEGLDYFHMTDFEAWVPPFDFKLPDGSRDKAKHNRLLNALLDLMLEQIDGFYGFGAVSMFDPTQPAISHHRLMEDCVNGAIKNAVLDVADFYQQPLHLVFGKQKHFPEDKIRRYVDIYSYGPTDGRIATFTTAEPKCIRPLQAADIFAYEMARAQRSGRPERYPFQRLLDGAKSRNLRFLMYWGPVRSSEVEFAASRAFAKGRPLS